MMERMPVLSQDDVWEYRLFSERVDERDNLVAVMGSKRATFTKVVLYVNDDENLLHLLS